MNAHDLIRLERYRSQCSWIGSYGFVTMLAQSIAATRIAEVGVAYGYHAEYLLQTLPQTAYVGIDPYRAGYDDTDVLAADVAKLFADEPQRAMDRLYQAVACKLVLHNGRANLVRQPGAEAATLFRDGCFDLAYIDGDHTYEGVKADLAAWYPKVRPGGILCGDDLHMKGVADAVAEFFAPLQAKPIGYKAGGADYLNKWSVVIPS